jgi:sodium/potassium-transporting ATPase subunit alpha
MAAPQKLNSTLIRNYVQASQNIEMQLEVDRQAKINGITKRRGVKQVDTKKKEEKKDSGKDSIKDLDQHRLTWDQLCSRLEIDKDKIFTQGLTSEQAKERNIKQGDNVLSAKKTTPWWAKLLHEWTAPFALLLWAGSALCFIAYGLDESDPSNLYLGIVLAIVVMITGLVTFFQNAKSESVMEGFKNFIPPKCLVLRDGKEDQINATKLVTGDIVILKEGGRIPADVRIIESKDMRVDNSSLTGESDPLLRSPECTEPEKILETKNVAFFGTLCKEGRGKGMVFNIGDNTVIGQIASLAEGASSSETPLRRELNRFIKIVTVIALVFGLIFFCLGFALKYGIIQNLVFAIGIIVANVPEGLLATITITLSVASAKMHAKKVLVKNLESVETLGSTSCICSDKTGTLTQNKMTIENIFYDGEIFKGANKEKMGPKYNYAYNSESSSFKALRDCAVVGSEAVFSTAMPDKFIHRIDALNKANEKQYNIDRQVIEKEWNDLYASMPYYEKPVSGDASETAIVKFFQPIEDILTTRARYPIGKQKDGAPSVVPFNSAHKFALKVVRCKTATSEWCIFLKGAPERVWDKCSHVLYKDREVPLDKEQKKIIENANVSFAKGGQRILGFAKYHLPRNEYPENHQFVFNGPFEVDIPMDRLVFVGLVSLIDPPRDAVPDAIQKCKTAGIKVIMVTGDQQLTAAAIAKQIGIFEDETSVELQERVGCSYDEAVEKARAIVVNGDMLTKAYQEDEGLPDNKKGKKLERWLQKPQIVFARTSPAQKLYIVKGCQKLGYIVAVTGDGVNDSPAINQADIGIAMGITGSDVAKDSADMVLLNDDFSAIIMGIEEGRKIFDNLKKSIAYTLTSNIPELIPFLSFIVIQIPLPLSTVLILCVDLGTDMIPAVSFSYEEAELDIMTRRPRDRDEHLVTAKLMIFAYAQMGVMQTFCGYMGYIVVLFDFGFNLYESFYIVLKHYYPHNHSDTFINDPSLFYGNSNVDKRNPNGKWELYVKDENSPGALQDSKDKTGPRLVDWLFTVHMDQDLRMGYLKIDEVSGEVSANLNYSPCRVYQISPVSHRPVCYSTEALKYAQTAFFFGVVIGQFYNSLACKTRKISLKDQGLKNFFMIFGWISEFVVCICLAYILPINHVFGTRDLILPHFFLPGVPHGLLMLIWDEVRKYLIRNWPTDDLKFPNWFERNVCY